MSYLGYLPMNKMKIDIKVIMFCVVVRGCNEDTGLVEGRDVNIMGFAGFPLKHGSNIYDINDKDYFAHNILCGSVGRDSNRNLQKALKVGKLRDKMPAMIEKLRYEMAAWEEVGVLRTLYLELPRMTSKSG